MRTAHVTTPEQARRFPMRYGCGAHEFVDRCGACSVLRRGTRADAVAFIRDALRDATYNVVSVVRFRDVEGSRTYHWRRYVRVDARTWLRYDRDVWHGGHAPKTVRVRS